jgi:general secretion pathway protein K
MTSLPIRHQRGVALIMAVLIVALATMLAVSVASEGYMDQRRTSTVLILDQAYELGLGAEALAADTLNKDAKDTTIDTPNEGWATLIVLPVDDGIGEIKGNLEDLQGRFNLNNLLDSNGLKNVSAIKQFERLLALLEIDPKWATTTVDWIDSDTSPEASGAEDSIYAGQSPAYLTANMVITRASELMSQVGMEISTFRKLEPYVVALPNNTSLNVCTASALVLDSLATTKQQYSTDMTTFAENRANGCYPKLQDILRDFKGDPDFDQRALINNSYLVESSNYFRANILVSIGSVELAMYSVLSRSGNPNNAKVRVIQRSFGTT